MEGGGGRGRLRWREEWARAVCVMEQGYDRCGIRRPDLKNESTFRSRASPLRASPAGIQGVEA